MHSYHCFFLNLRSAVSAVEIIEAESDEHAVRRAETLFRQKGAWFSGYEVWDCDRRLHREMNVAHV